MFISFQSVINKSKQAQFSTAYLKTDKHIDKSSQLNFFLIGTTTDMSSNETTNWINMTGKNLILDGTLFGYIYLVTNEMTGKKYIGKKQFYFYKKVLLPGAKRRKTIATESNWKSYTGSSTYLNADIEKFGKDKFRFEIIHLCANKGQLHYMEVYYQVTEGALTQYLPDGSRAFYNCRINSVKFLPRF